MGNVGKIKRQLLGTIGTKTRRSSTDDTTITFQNVSAQHLRNLDEPIECDVLVCGDDVEAREVVIDLASAGRMRGVHAGPLVNSVVAEALTSILIGINRRYKVPGAGISITGLSGETTGPR